MTAYTPIYNLPYVEASDLVASYPTVSEELAENVETAIAGSGGLSLIDEESFSAVSSVSLNNVFSATYQNYKILLLVSSSASAGANLRLRASGSDITTNDYYSQRITGINTTVSATRPVYPGTALTAAFAFNTTGLVNSLILDVFNPFAAAPTNFLTLGGASTDLYISASQYASSTSADGFTIYPGSGTITGTIRVYGYKGA